MRECLGMCPQSWDTSYSVIRTGSGQTHIKFMGLASLGSREGVVWRAKVKANTYPACSQVLWMRRLRVLRRLLVKYRASGKIDKHLYHELYHLSKGNTFKHKRALVEHVGRMNSNFGTAISTGIKF